MSTPTTMLARELIRMACCAPSIHNTQPWAWRLVDEHTIELHADRSRQLAETDPEGRALVISCGAALHHLAVAAEGFGLVVKTQLQPDGDAADFLARIRLEPGETTVAAVETMTALENRMTDRRGFTDWEVPVARLEELAEAATGWGAHAMLLLDPGQVVQAKALVQEARTEQRVHSKIAQEQEDWTNRSPQDGVPVSNASPHVREGVARDPDRFNPGPSTSDATTSGTGPAHRPGDKLLLLYTSHDDQSAWLAAGQALSALWIQATQGGISLAPDTQVIEVPRVRELLRHRLLDDLGHPQVLVHLGWQETARPPQQTTPRRSLADVLLP